MMSTFTCLLWGRKAGPGMRNQHHLAALVMRPVSDVGEARGARTTTMAASLSTHTHTANAQTAGWTESRRVAMSGQVTMAPAGTLMRVARP
jgi:hypothetical protein